MTAGDFGNDGVLKDRLIFALSHSGMLNTKIYFTVSNHLSFDSSQIFLGPDNYWYITAMAFGNFSDDNKITEELLIAFSNNVFNHTTIYKTDDPVINGIGSKIYDPGFQSEYYVSALTSGSFRESLHLVTSIDEDKNVNNNTIVENFILFQNYPNPFNPLTIIKYQIPEFSFVTIKIYDVLGKKIATLVNEEKPADNYGVEFYSHSSQVSKLPAGREGLSSGIYFNQLNAGNYVETKKMVMLHKLSEAEYLELTLYYFYNNEGYIILQFCTTPPIICFLTQSINYLL
jgi:hypothetical protein